MTWNFINTFSSNGLFNMEFDLELARICKADEAFFRLYRWKPFCISLGANQKFDDINLELAKANNIDVVKRPTGGRAILHAEEITYSVVVPTAMNITAKELYRKISLAIITALKKYDDRLSTLALEEEQPDFNSLRKRPEGKLCFASAAKNEIKYEGKKIVGSAQRKLNHSLLQHGSILCGTHHRKLIDYISSNNSFSDLSQKTIELETILNERTDYERLADSLKSGFEEVFATKLRSEGNLPLLNLVSQTLE